MYRHIRCGFKKRRKRRLLDDDKLGTSVFCPCSFVAPDNSGFFLAVADNGKISGIDAKSSQIVLDGLGTTLAQSQVVFG